MMPVALLHEELGRAVFLQIEVMKLNGFLKVNDSWYTG
jgi:hypothetical protein